MDELIIEAASAASSTILEIASMLSVTEEAQKQQKSSNRTEKYAFWKPQTTKQKANKTMFIMYCIARSVGLGNMWRFPFVAYRNGGGAFFIPYIVVLILIGKPLHYIECIVGQFSSRTTINIWVLSKAMQGTAYAGCLGCFYILSYYVSIIGLCLHYLAMSFAIKLPWTVCDTEWTDVLCISPSETNEPGGNDTFSSTELYFIRHVIQQNAGLEFGLGWPILLLAISLFFAWFIVFLVCNEDVKLSGKSSYFFAIFPYTVLVSLLISTCILDGAFDGILFFIKPVWRKLADIDVWYAAVTQCFFSLSVGMGPVILVASYNDFRDNIFRDSMIITSLDMLVSLLSGCTVFAILGNLAFTLNQDIKDVVGTAGAGLPFIAYPEAVARSPLPHLFSVMFFFMMTLIGVDSAIGLLSTLVCTINFNFPSITTSWITGICCIFGFLISLIYVTPGGLYVLELVDHYGGEFLILFCAICEFIGIFWIYGLDSVCIDTKFMSDRNPNMYWRLCWGVLAPLLMILVFLYALFMGSNNVFLYDLYYVYPITAYVVGLCMLFLGILIVQGFIGFAIIRENTIKQAFESSQEWSPVSFNAKTEWMSYKRRIYKNRKIKPINKSKHIRWSVFNFYQEHDKDVPVVIDEEDTGKEKIKKRKKEKPDESTLSI